MPTKRTNKPNEQTNKLTTTMNTNALTNQTNALTGTPNASGNSSTPNALTGTPNASGNSSTPKHDLLDPYEEKPRDLCVFIRKFKPAEKIMLEAFGYAPHDLFLTPEFLTSEHLDPDTFPSKFREDITFFFSGIHDYSGPLKNREIASKVAELRIKQEKETDPTIKESISAEIFALNKSKLEETEWEKDLWWNDIHPDLIWHAEKATQEYKKYIEAENNVLALEYLRNKDPRDPDFMEAMKATADDLGMHTLAGFIATILQIEPGAFWELRAKFNKDNVEFIHLFTKTYFEKFGHRVQIFGWPEESFTETTLKVRLSFTVLELETVNTQIEILLMNMIRDGHTSYTLKFPTKEKVVGRVMHFALDWFKRRGLEGFCTFVKQYSEDKGLVELTFKLGKYGEHEQFVFDKEKGEYIIPDETVTASVADETVTAPRPRAPVADETVTAPRPRPPRAPVAGETTTAPRFRPPRAHVRSWDLSATAPATASAIDTTRLTKAEERRIASANVVQEPNYCLQVGHVPPPVWDKVSVCRYDGMCTNGECRDPHLTERRMNSGAGRLFRGYNCPDREKCTVMNCHMWHGIPSEDEVVAPIPTSSVQEPKICLQAGDVPPPIWDRFTVCKWNGLCTNGKCTDPHLTVRKTSKGALFAGCNCPNRENCTVLNCPLWHGTPSVPEVAVAPVCLSIGAMPPVTSGNVPKCHFGTKKDGSGCTNMKCTNLHLFPRFKSDGSPVTFTENCSKGRACKKVDCNLLHPCA